MTDNEIKKAIEICAKNSVTRHNGLTYQGMPLHFLFEEILGFVNRQKAEIDGLLEQLSNADYDRSLWKQEKAMVESEAVKEFAERLKEKLYSIPTVYNSHFGRMIDNLVKEFTEGKNDEKT